MKPTQPFVAPAVPSGASMSVQPEGPLQRHPAAVEFVRGVEVTEVVDSLPGELLELFASLTPGKGS